MSSASARDGSSGGEHGDPAVVAANSELEIDDIILMAATGSACWKPPFFLK
jgi:hypothetical protein